MEKHPFHVDQRPDVMVPYRKYIYKYGSQTMTKTAEIPTSDNDKHPSTQTTTYMLAQAFHALRALWIEPALKAENLTSLQFTLLSVVDRHAGLSSADLSRRFYVTPQTMGQVLSALETRGLLIREENPANRRLLAMSLTPTGHALVKTCQTHMQQIEQEVFGELNEKELVKFRTTLHKIVGKIRER
ncbi:winged helix-turn-helix transcriptional regulator [Pseudomonas capeferrum]|uniref:MarR family winged helix-turn-helix transcriptional regulator n=1 Tax=Pseudomonas capeferrum TaxID=1495066 RepID=UPI0015E46674|nr:MarR family winged helix-turn-helix transcriptional regulator [Pseudomonas capeferrum]MBA1204820.1 winged helix-turn-helix transcriptional regulator [Pseudomonas capeferrum]